MFNRRFSLRSLLVAASVMLLASCEPGSEVFAPVEEPAETLTPQQLGPEMPEFKKTFQGPDGFTVVLGEAIDGETVTEIIGRDGGLIMLPARSGQSCTQSDADAFFSGAVGSCHTLFVPEGSVKQNTYFTMTRVPGNEVYVELTASKHNNGGNEVGARGFRIPVYLLLNYGAAGAQVPDDHVAVAWKKPNGQLLGMPSAVAPDYDVVIAELNHFSGYIVVRL